MAKDQKPKELWISKDHTLDKFDDNSILTAEPNVCELQWYTHVIEYSAYEALEKELAQDGRQAAYRYRQIDHAVSQMGGWANFKTWIINHAAKYFESLELERKRSRKLHYMLEILANRPDAKVSDWSIEINETLTQYERSK